MRINRADFLPLDKKDLSHMDSPIPIGFNQTISQPSTVINMLEWLDVNEGDKVLDVGSGSGWTTALLSIIVGLKGYVYAVEIIPELLEFGRNNCQKYGLMNVRFFLAEKGILGLPDKAPFDRILVSASANELPARLVAQLKPGGKMVVPVMDSIIEITKNDSGKITRIAHPGYIFVPLV